MNKTLAQFKEEESRKIEEIKNKKLDYLIKELSSKNIVGVNNLRIVANDKTEYYNILYDLVIDESIDFVQKDNSYHWYYNESLDTAVENIIKENNYILELYSKYKSNCLMNEFIQKHLVYEKHIVSNIYKKGIIRFELGNLLILPNTTSCSCGGGDYEVRKVPEKANEFINNIDNYITCLIDAVTDLNTIKKEFTELRNKLDSEVAKQC